MAHTHEHTMEALVERGKLILERRDELKVANPEWTEGMLRATAIKQLADEGKIKLN